MWDLVGNPEDRFSQNEAHFRDIIRQCANCGKDDVVIFTGSGATAGLHKIAWGLKINMPRVAEETVSLVEKFNFTKSSLSYCQFGPFKPPPPPTHTQLLTTVLLSWRSVLLFYYNDLHVS